MNSSPTKDNNEKITPPVCPPVRPPWLEDAVFYEIYPQTFFDTTGDGIGELAGIQQKLDYIQSLGVTAIWINPCFESPFQDAGYDVSDYYKIAPRYGTNEDMRHLFVEARKRGIRILLDLVPGHTSIEHPWFKASCQHEHNEYSDYYIWTDSAWVWQVPGYRLVSGYAERDGSFLTNFFYFQPALNYGFANPDPAYPWQQAIDAPGPQRVRQELKNIMRFWLEMGASGFRVDMAASLVKGDIGSRETIRLWQEIRAWLDKEFPDACIISEWGVPSHAIQAGFHLDFCIPFGMPGYVALLRKPYSLGPGSDPYGFSFFDSRGSGNIREFMDEFLRHYANTNGKGLMAFPTGNHDINPRLSQDRTTDDLELIYLFMMTMPFVPVIYYGDEIGMRTLQGLPSKEGGYSRTGSRTPMQWEDAPNAGFSSAPEGQLYLPVDESPDRPTVSTQENDSSSLLNRLRRLVSLRKSHPALQARGNFEIVYAEVGAYPLVYKRTLDETLIIAINPAARPVEIEIPFSTPLPPGLIQKTETLYGLEGAILYQENCLKIHLPGVSGIVYRI